MAKKIADEGSMSSSEDEARAEKKRKKKVMIFLHGLLRWVG
jgi:hypothetical protein